MIKIVTDTGEAMITLDELKTYLKFEATESNEDNLIVALEKSARVAIENKTGLSLYQKTYEYQVKHDVVKLNDGRIEIPRYPVIHSSNDLEYVKSVSSTNTENTLTRNTGYYLDNQFAEVVHLTDENEQFLVGDVTWYNYKIGFKAGYGANTMYLPEDLKHAIKLLVYHWYYNRTMSDEGEMPFNVKAILNSYKW